VWGPTFEIMNERTEAFDIFYTILILILTPGMLFAILGYGKVLLNKPSKLLSYCNESVYPLYILHQSVQLSIGYFILQLNWGIFPKFVLVVIGTFGISLLIYELFIRRFNVARLFFGLKFKHKPKGTAISENSSLIYEEGR
jgi:peptidoglycan/LPS O-acetylase OafA/YrhL